MPAPPSNTESFDQVRREPSLSDKVVNSITEAIVSGRFQPGERLDSERELAEQFGVSRTVIREAVRSLTAHGLVEVRSGRGVQVAKIGGDAIGRSMGLYLRSNPDLDYEHVHEVRSALEIEIAGLAAKRATPEDLARLASLNEQLGAGRPKDEATALLDVEFHRAIASATQNQLFVVMLDSVGDVLLEIRRAAFSSPQMLDYACRAHALILARLNARDVDAARAAMRTHLEEAKRAWVKTV